MTKMTLTSSFLRGVLPMTWTKSDEATASSASIVAAAMLIGTLYILPLDVDSINENDSVANPDPTPRIASVHKSRFAEVVLVGCWIEAVYYGLLLFTMT